MCINMEVKHIAGARNQMADYLSRYSLRDKDIPEVEIPRPFNASRSLSTKEAGLEIKNPLVHWISVEGEQDDDYHEMIKCINDNDPARGVSASSEMKNMESFCNLLSVKELSNNKMIIVNDGTEVLIPKNLRKEMIQRLHYTHLAQDSMIQIAKNSFFWPGIKRDLGATYRGCESCLLNAKAKVCKKQDTIPLGLVGKSPGEELSLD